MKKSQSIENRGMPAKRIAWPPIKRYRMPAALNSRSRSFIRRRRLGQLPEDRLFPNVHFRVRRKSPAAEMRQFRRRTLWNDPDILRPQPIFGFVIVGYFHARNMPIQVKSIRVSREKQPHHIFDFVLSWTWVSSSMTASYSIINKISAGCPNYVCKKQTYLPTCTPRSIEESEALLPVVWQPFLIQVAPKKG
jgi:hypothetical protein